MTSKKPWPRVAYDPAFAQALLDEAIVLFVNGEPESAKLILRDLVNATLVFEALAEEIHKPAKHLHRILSRSGNPTMNNISAVFAAIKRALKVEVHMQVGRPDLGIKPCHRLPLRHPVHNHPNPSRTRFRFILRDVQRGANRPGSCLARSDPGVPYC